MTEALVKEISPHSADSRKALRPLTRAQGVTGRDV